MSPLSTLSAEQLITSNERTLETPPGFVDAWRQTHYAAQAAAELGKSWGELRDDDSHSSLSWFEDDDADGLEGVTTVGGPELRSRLDLRHLRLSIVDPQGAARAKRELDGATLAEALTWITTTATKLHGPPRQPAVPAPDLSEHPVGSGATFDVSSGLAFAAVSDWYAAANAVLDRLRVAAPVFSPARCWPHHFDLASLAVVTTDASGAMAATIGVGFTPPDTLDDHGYWYVGPWRSVATERVLAWPELTAGRWHDHGGPMPMGVLSVSDIVAAGGSTRQLEVIARFVCEAINACRVNLQ